MKVSDNSDFPCYSQLLQKIKFFFLTVWYLFQRIFSPLTEFYEWNVAIFSHNCQSVVMMRLHYISLYSICVLNNSFVCPLHYIFMPPHEKQTGKLLNFISVMFECNGILLKKLKKVQRHSPPSMEINHSQLSLFSFSPYLPYYVIQIQSVSKQSLIISLLFLSLKSIL